jgi:hypothetical protein
MGSSLEDLPRDADRRLPHVEASGLRPSSRIRRNAACLGNLIDVTRAVPIQGPLPDIAVHVVDAVAIWRKCVHRGGSIESVGRQVYARKISLPGIRHVATGRRELARPRKFDSIQTATRREFPFGLGWQIAPPSSGIGLRVGKGHMDDRTIF